MELQFDDFIHSQFIKEKTSNDLSIMLACPPPHFLHEMSPVCINIFGRVEVISNGGQVGIASDESETFELCQLEITVWFCSLLDLLPSPSKVLCGLPACRAAATAAMTCATI